MTEWIIANKFWLLLGASTLFVYFWLAQYKKKLRINDLTAIFLALLNTVISVVFAKIFAFLEGEPGGMSLFGGVFFLPVAYFAGAKITKRNVAEVFDIFTIPTVATVMCARVNCLIVGCCGGKIIPGTENIRWPTQLTELLFYIVLIIILGNLVSKNKCHGTAYPIYLISYGICRFVVEWFRETEKFLGYLHLSHLWALVALIVGACIYYFLTRKKLSVTGK